MLRRAKKTKPAKATPGWVAWAVIAGVALILCVGLAVGAMQWMGGGSSTSHSAASPAATTHTTAALAQPTRWAPVLAAARLAAALARPVAVAALLGEQAVLVLPPAAA